jgi:hypothetical protein
MFCEDEYEHSVGLNEPDFVKISIQMIYYNITLLEVLLVHEEPLIFANGLI